MKEVDRDFWMSCLDNILTYSSETWAHLALDPGIIGTFVSGNQDAALQDQAVPV